jgi:hypothetical protein
MALTIIWSPKSEKTFAKIVNYILQHFTEQEVKKFITEVNKKLEVISLFPESYPISPLNKKIHRCVIHKLTSMVYRYDEEKQLIEIVMFWDNRTNPEKLEY